MLVLCTRHWFQVSFHESSSDSIGYLVFVAGRQGEGVIADCEARCKLGQFGIEQGVGHALKLSQQDLPYIIRFETVLSYQDFLWLNLQVTGCCQD